MDKRPFQIDRTNRGHRTRVTPPNLFDCYPSEVGKVETARCYAERGLSSAASARMIEYVGMAKGNRAWVNLRDGDAAARSRAMIESTVRLLLRCGVRQQ